MAHYYILYIVEGVCTILEGIQIEEGALIEGLLYFLWNDGYSSGQHLGCNSYDLVSPKLSKHLASSVLIICKHE